MKVLIAVMLVLTLLGVGCISPHEAGYRLGRAHAKSLGTTRGGPSMSAAEFKDEYMGKFMGEVRSLLGTPYSVRGSESKLVQWCYRDVLLTDPSGLIVYPCLYFNGNLKTVEEITFSQRYRSK